MRDKFKSSGDGTWIGFLVDRTHTKNKKNQHFKEGFNMEGPCICAITRNLPEKTFCDGSLKMEKPTEAIDIDKAVKQHNAYVEQLKRIIRHVIVLKEDESHGDCCFVEDPVVVIGNRAVVNRMGAKERRGEELEIKKTLQDKTIVHKSFQIYCMNSSSSSSEEDEANINEACCDGGDVLFVESTGHIFVGISSRTNEKGFQFLKSVFQEKYTLFAIQVPKGLHLKSCLTYLPHASPPNGQNKQAMLVAQNDSGKLVWKAFESSKILSETYAPIFIPDPLASNVLCIKLDKSLKHNNEGELANAKWAVFYQGDKASEKILLQHCGQNVVMIRMDMSELAKADGALTCCSVLIHDTN